MLASSKQRTTWAIACVSRTCARNRLPSPSPSEAPATRPAISINSMTLGITRSGRTISARRSNLGSGTGTTPVFGSIVQKGKFSDSTLALVSALNNVDLPTFGNPTIPQLNPINCRPTLLRVREKESSLSANALTVQIQRLRRLAKHSRALYRGRQPTSSPV